MINNVQLSGYVYSHSLTEAVSKNNNTYIRGRMEIALDDEFTRVIPVQWLVMESRKEVFDTIKGIMDTGITVESGKYKNKNEITRVRISGNIDVNDFISRNTGQMVTYQQIRGAFIHIMRDPMPEENDCTFSADVYLNNAEYVEESEGREAYMKLNGFAFDFRGHLIPVEFNTCTPEGGYFFENEHISQDDPYFSTVYGRVEPSTVVSTREVDSSEMGFGEPIVRETTRRFINWEITSAKVSLGLDESTVTEEEMINANAERQKDLEEVRKRYNDANGNSSAATAFGTAPKPGGNSSGAKNTSTSGFVF